MFPGNLNNLRGDRENIYTTGTEIDPAFMSTANKNVFTWARSGAPLSTDFGMALYKF